MRYKTGALMMIGFFLILVRSNAQPPEPVPLRIIAYVGIVHPIVSIIKDKSSFNFNGSYTVGFPIGINFWKTKRIGLSMEFVPFVKSEHSASKMSNFLFHPGVVVGFQKGWTFAGRLAFETSGRYGFTPVINKIVRKNKSSSYFVAVPFPLRFGNEQPFNFGASFQFGIIF